jgi:retinoid hydroxylase
MSSTPAEAATSPAHARKGSLPLPPGRLGLPFLGETLPFLRDPIRFFERRSREHGAIFKTRILGETVVCLVGPEAVSFLYDERYFQREGGSPPHLKEIFGELAVVFKDDAAHRRTRRLMAHAFSPEALDAYRPTVDRIVARYVRRWATAGDVRGVDEVGALCFAIADSLFGGAEPDFDDAHHAELFQTFVRGILALPIEIPGTTWARAMRARDELRASVGRSVDSYQPGARSTVLGRMLEAQDEGGARFSRDEVKTECLHFYAAAYAPVQAAACHLLVALARHPQVMERAREAARAGDLGYLDQVTREVRRLYPTVPSTFFARVREDCEFGGYRIPKGWKAVGALPASMRAPGAFEDPDRFDPDRFAPARGELSREPTAYLPHGGGPRDGHRCAGEALADLMLRSLAAGLLREHGWELPPQDLTLRQAGLTPLPADGLRIRFRRL